MVFNAESNLIINMKLTSGEVNNAINFLYLGESRNGKELKNNTCIVVKTYYDLLSAAL